MIKKKKNFFSTAKDIKIKLNPQDIKVSPTGKHESNPSLMWDKATVLCFFFQAEDGIRDGRVTGVQTCALPISSPSAACAELTCTPCGSAPRSRRCAWGRAAGASPAQAARRRRRTDDYRQGEG